MDPKEIESVFPVMSLSFNFDNMVLGEIFLPIGQLPLSLDDNKEELALPHQ